MQDYFENYNNSFKEQAIISKPNSMNTVSTPIKREKNSEQRVRIQHLKHKNNSMATFDIINGSPNAKIQKIYLRKKQFPT